MTDSEECPAQVRTVASGTPARTHSDTATWRRSYSRSSGAIFAQRTSRCRFREAINREQLVMKRLGAERYSKSRWKYGDTVAFAADREASG